MPTSYTALLGLALPVTGELSGTWGDVVSNYITQYVDSAVAGTQTISGSQTAVTLSVTNGSSLVTAGSGSTGSAQFQIINCTGNPAGLLTITAPASSRQYIIINATSTSQSVKIVGTGPTTGVTILSGEKAHVAWNGSDFVKIATQSGNGSFVDLTVSGSMTLSGGTANGVLYLNGSKVATSGSALTFDGTNLGIGGTPTATGAYSNLNINGSSGGQVLFGTAGSYQQTIYNTSTSLNYYASNASSHIWSISAAEQMRLTSTGLGIGTSSPGAKLHVSSASDDILRLTATAPYLSFYNGSTRTGYIRANTAGVFGIVSEDASTPMAFYTAGAEVMRLSTSGNLGLGVTPSAWNSAQKALQVGNTAAFYSASSGAWIGNNFFNDSTPTARYITSNFASAYGLNANGQHQWFTAASGTAGNAITFTQAMTLDASGNLGIVTTSPGSFDASADNLVVGTTSGNNGITIAAGTTGGSTINFADGTAGGAQYAGYIDYQHSGDYMRFGTNGGTERARITSGGDLLVGTVASSSARLYVRGSGTTSATASFEAANSSGATRLYVQDDGTTRFFGSSGSETARITSGGDLLVGKTATNAAVVGIQLLPSGAAQFTRSGSTNATSTLDVYSTGASAYRFYVDMAGTIFATSTTISAISDQRFKENIVDLDVGLNAIMALKPRKFDWKAGKGKDKKNDRGFIAQEFEQVFPDLIDEWKDPAPEGEEPYKSVRQDLIPVLVKAIQEQQALIEQLTSRIAALESKGV